MNDLLDKCPVCGQQPSIEYTLGYVVIACFNHCDLNCNSCKHKKICYPLLIKEDYKYSDEQIAKLWKRECQRFKKDVKND